MGAIVRLYLDANAIIYAMERNDGLRDQVADYIRQAEKSPSGVAMNSVLSRLECRIKPLRDGNQTLLQQYERFFSHSRFRMLGISRQIIDLATQLRAQHGFKTPDAIQLASAIESDAELFLTGDAALSRCVQIPVEVLRT